MVHERIVKEKEVSYLAEIAILDSELKHLKEKCKENSVSQKLQIKGVGRGLLSS